MDDINDFAAFGEKLADASGEIVLSYWRSQLEVIRKSDESPVTRAGGPQPPFQQVERGLLTP